MKRITYHCGNHIDTKCKQCQWVERCGGDYGKEPHLCRDMLLERLAKFEDEYEAINKKSRTC